MICMPLLYLNPPPLAMYVRCFQCVFCWFVPLPAGMAGGKYRSFLVHIKAVSDKGMEESPRPVMRMPIAKPQSSKGHSLSTLLQRAQATKVQRANHWENKCNFTSKLFISGVFLCTPEAFVTDGAVV